MARCMSKGFAPTVFICFTCLDAFSLSVGFLSTSASEIVIRVVRSCATQPISRFLVRSREKHGEMLQHQGSTAQQRIFSWLGLAPRLNSACHKALLANFPGALPSQVVHFRSRFVLEQEPGNTPGKRHHRRVHLP